jgi:hypothetical protein
MQVSVTWLWYALPFSVYAQTRTGSCGWLHKCSDAVSSLLT